MNDKTVEVGRWAVAIVVFGLAVDRLAGECYVVTDLGTLPGATEIHVRDMNSKGQVVGYASVNNVSRAFLASGGVMTDLGSLALNGESLAHGINDAGQMVGSSQTDDGGLHAFLYAGGLMIDLGTLGGDSSAATAINNAGQITGYSQTAEGECHAFIWQRGVTTDIGELGVMACEVWDINDLGQIVGVQQMASSRFHAFVWNLTLGLVDIGAFGGVGGWPYRINNNGEIVGAVWTGEANAADEPVVRAVLYRNGGTSDLGTLGGDTSTALGINDLGQVVGRARIASGEHHAFVYDKINGMRDLNEMISPDSPWVLETASSINSAGEIAGVGLVDGKPRAFLLQADVTDTDGDGVPDGCEVAAEPSSKPTGQCGGGALPAAALTTLLLTCLRPARRRAWG